MKAKRTLVVGEAHEIYWASVAVGISPAGPDKEGFYVAVFPDGKTLTTVFLRPDQAIKLIELAKNPSSTDAEIWDYVAKIPMEPLAPSRALGPKLRALLADFGTDIYAEARRQLDRPRKLDPVTETDPGIANPNPLEQIAEIATEGPQWLK